MAISLVTSLRSVEVTVNRTAWDLSKIEAKTNFAEHEVDAKKTANFWSTPWNLTTKKMKRLTFKIWLLS